MKLCIEGYMGKVGGYEGVKLERQVLVTDTGCEMLDTFPFGEDLLLREVSRDPSALGQVQAAL